MPPRVTSRGTWPACATASQRSRARRRASSTHPCSAGLLSSSLRRTCSAVSPAAGEGGADSAGFAAGGLAVAVATFTLLLAIALVAVLALFFQYTSTGAVIPSGGAQCLSASCDAHLDLMTLVATFHSGAGVGFHQIVELNGGIVAYRNLKQDSDGAKLAPSGGNIDPLFALGYGFGYGLSDRTNLDIISDYSFALHERKDLSNGTSNTNSMPALRLSLRMGFGGTARRR